MIYEITEYKALESLITTSTNTAQEYMKHKALLYLGWAYKRQLYPHQ